MDEYNELVKQLIPMEDADWLYHLYEQIEIKDSNRELENEHQIFYDFIQQPEIFMPLGLEYILNLFIIAKETDKERILKILVCYIAKAKELYQQYSSNFNIEYIYQYALLYEFYIEVPFSIVRYVQDNDGLLALKDYQESIHFPYDEDHAYHNLETIKDVLVEAPYYLITFYLEAKNHQTKKAYELLKKEFFGKHMQYDDLFIETSYHLILENEYIFAYDCLSFLEGSLPSLSSDYEISYYYLLLYLYSKKGSPTQNEKKKQKTIQKIQYLLSSLNQSSFQISKEDYPRLYEFLNKDPLFVIRPNISLSDYPNLLKKNVQLYQFHFRVR